MFISRSRFRLLLACAAAPACFGGAQPPASPTPMPALADAGRGVDVSMEGTLDYHQDSGVIVAVPDERGNPVLTTSGARLEAGRILYDRPNRSVSADAGVMVDFKKLRILSEKVDYSASLRRLDTGRVRFGMLRGGADAESVQVVTSGKGKVETSQATANKVTVYFNEPDPGVISVSAEKISYSSETRILQLNNVVFRIGVVPVLYLPSYEQEGLALPPVDPELQVGASRQMGAFMRTTTFLTVNPRWQPGVLLDAYGNSGVLVGPALRYDTAELPEGAPAAYNVMKGELRAGFIHDNGDLGLDQYGQQISEDRYFVHWDHKQKLGDGLEVTNSLNWWSDSFVTRDFRPKLFDGYQSPDNFLEVVYPDRDYYASVFVRHDPNGFENIARRLPEVRIDLNPREISDWRLYQRGHASFVYLREETSPELPVLPGTTDAVLDTPRFDAYYGLSRPVTPDSSVGITPVAGVRSTTWFDAEGGEATYTRLAGQVGFDSHLLATGRWDYENTIWEINGMRHRLRPVLQYRYLPGATDGDGSIPRIDRAVFLTAPPPIDLQQRRDTDEIHETQILRVGMENLFQTQHVEYGSRDLVQYNLYQDFRDTDQPGARVMSDTYSQVKLTPAEWLDFTLYNRLDPYSGDLHETTTATTFHDGDRWKLIVGTQRVTDVMNLDQYFVAWQYKLNSLYTVLTEWRYDADTNVLTNQEYALRQQLGHSWSVDYVLGYRRNAGQNSGTSIGVRMRLVTF